MAKKKKRVNQQSNLVRILRSKRILYGLLGVVVVLFAVHVYLHRRDINRQATKQKADYGVVDEQMQKIMTGIIAAAGQPAEIHKTYGCAKTAAKFDEGSMTCNISYDFYYNINSQNQAISITKDIIPVLHEQSSSIFTIPNDLQNITSSLTYKYDTAKVGIGCSMDYQVKDQAWFNGADAKLFGQKTTASNVARYSFGCGGPVARALYPIQKSE